MKPILLAAVLAVPLAFSGCAGTYVGYDGGGYGPGYYTYGGPGYYDGVYGDVAVYGYNRGGYRANHHHYDGSYHNSAVASRSFSHAGSGARVASAGHSGGGGGGAAHASASVGGGGGGHR
jgi:heterogeneous nuclear ribonucleoprotein A1/A3